MPSELQNFDLYELGSRTAADMYEDNSTSAVTSDQLIAVIGQIVNEGGTREALQAMDFSRADHREYLAGTIAHAMLQRGDIRITSKNTSKDK